MRYIFNFINEDIEKVVAKCYYNVTLLEEDAHAEVLDKDKAPFDFTLYTNLNDTKQVLSILKSRVLPPNRMFLEEALKPYNISVDDWIGKMQLNKGRTYDDHCRVEIEEYEK